jgi:DNA-binding MarR family transcriptional regulator
MAPTGLRSTQFSILMVLKRIGPMTINALSAKLVMDRTTLGRNILPLEREGLVTIKKTPSDRRSKEVCLTEAGTERLRAAIEKWDDAQARFEASFGAERASELRTLACAVVAVPSPDRID